MSWEEVISVILLLILTAVLAVDIPEDRDLCGLPQKRRTNTGQSWETQGQHSTSAFLTLSYYHFGLS